MRFYIVSQEIVVTDALKSYAEKKISKIKKFFPDENFDVTATFSVQRADQNIEILVKYKHLYIKSFYRSNDMYASIDGAVDKIERQIARYKDRMTTKKQFDEVQNHLRLDVYSADSIDKLKPKVIVTKTIDTKPMTVDEAVMQMELLNRDFFVFFNGISDSMSVVYKRDDGNIGLIEH